MQLQGSVEHGLGNTALTFACLFVMPFHFGLNVQQNSFNPTFDNPEILLM
jgi:hypothetical protein